MTSENDPPKGEMSHLDFLRAQFFSVAADSRQELDALAAFAQALEAMPRQARLPSPRGGHLGQLLPVPVPQDQRGSYTHAPIVSERKKLS